MREKIDFRKRKNDRGNKRQRQWKLGKIKNDSGNREDREN